VAKTIVVSDSTDLLPDVKVAARYGVDPRTLYRWDAQPALGFPKPLRINHRKYRRIHDAHGTAMWSRVMELIARRTTTTTVKKVQAA
jgi:hypothetical protein